MNEYTDDEMRSMLGAFRPPDATAAAKGSEFDAWRRGWSAAIEAALLKVPGGDICDPQDVADEIRTLKIL